MARHLIVAGIDFGTSFTKVVLRDNNTSGSTARVATFPGHSDGLLPSLLGIKGESLVPSEARDFRSPIPYLKMVAAHVADGTRLALNLLINI